MLQALEIRIVLALLDVRFDAQSFHLKLDDAAVDLVYDCGFGGEFVFQLGAGLVYQVNGCEAARASIATLV